MLTNEEIDHVAKSTDGPKSEWLACFARAIEAKVLKKQATEADPNAPWLTEAHMLCSDNGIQHGNITERIRALRDKLEKQAAQAAQPNAGDKPPQVGLD
jgi:hypothetical protein